MDTVAGMVAGAGWIQARSGEQRVPAWVNEPRLRVAGASLQAQHPQYDRLYPAFIVCWGSVLVVIGALGEHVGTVLFGLVALLVGIVSLRRVLRVWTIIDASGWHGSQGSIAREAIKEIVIFRGTDRRADFVRTLDGRRMPIGARLPAPWTRGMEIPSDAIDLFCHLQHDLAHELGWEPVPVRVDLGPGQTPTSFFHRCDHCTTPAAA